MTFPWTSLDIDKCLLQMQSVVKVGYYNNAIALRC